MGVVRPIAVVVPLFNEAARLDVGALARLVDDPRVALVLVDDGSTDDTFRRVDEFRAARPDRAQALRLERNGGKGEAVRRGLLAAIESGARTVGYADADMATPPEEILRVAALVADGGAEAALASRVALLGTEIRRSGKRHYLGRVFATAASLALRARVYDTQCGAKFFRVDDALRDAVAEPFLSRWVFDVELLGRLMAARRRAGRDRCDGIVETPLARWTDVGGSKLGLFAMFRAAWDLARVARDLRRRDVSGSRP